MTATQVDRRSPKLRTNTARDVMASVPRAFHGAQAANICVGLSHPAFFSANMGRQSDHKVVIVGPRPAEQREATSGVL